MEFTADWLEIDLEFYNYDQIFRMKGDFHRYELKYELIAIAQYFFKKEMVDQ